ncbi:hypothetical protein J6590_106250, partial [Homalodisca vitripennis]
KNNDNSPFFSCSMLYFLICLKISGESGPPGPPPSLRHCSQHEVIYITNEREHILNSDWERIGTANCLSGRWQSFKQYQGDAASFGQILSKMETNTIRSKMVQQRGTRNKMAHNYMGRQQH